MSEKMQKLELFQYAAAFNLNIGYYNRDFAPYQGYEKQIYQNHNTLE